MLTIIGLLYSCQKGLFDKSYSYDPNRIYEVGELIKDPPFEYKVNEASITKRDHKSKYLTINVYLINYDRDGRTFEPTMFILKDSDNNTYRPYSTDKVTVTLGHGQSITGGIKFLVPENTQKLRLEINTQGHINKIDLKL
ncbi:DUF4352 domain-containing protein [Paenibacillus zeisoli]|uniref:DUF4352 domain-containing protein n=1 Tax=Paenibacillus zeisoli TaxID=2496267 RepID=A0A3S1D935_9BACL|nr:DUF4352 domain-containing protein [Paenibacillus zeisoli]RUT31609.1 DUF4352 domain-containing protein [Paenibacillus zeisoli]